MGGAPSRIAVARVERRADTLEMPRRISTNSLLISRGARGRRRPWRTWIEMR
jgi:hypothetical protein